MSEPRTDLERVYDEQIAPLVARVIEIAKAHSMPMFATFELGADPTQNDEMLLCTTSISTRPDGENSPVVRKCYLVAREGYDVVRPWSAFSITTKTVKE